jgi:nickel-responsive transcriptional regulator NikR
MERFTISLDEKLASEFDRLIRERGYLNRSEAVRDMLRGKLDTLRLEDQQAPFCVASLSYVYNHHERDLAERLTELQHDHHDLVVASTHVHLDHENCLETVMCVTGRSIWFRWMKMPDMGTCIVILKTDGIDDGNTPDNACQTPHAE